MHEGLDVAQHPDRGEIAADRHPLVLVDHDSGLPLGAVFYFAQRLSHIRTLVAQRTHLAKL